MSDQRQKVKTPPDNYGRVYIEMLETTLSAHAKLCYGVMWSFGGSDCWATVASIGRRMSCSRPTVTKAQKELESKGWIEVDKDSKGRVSKTWIMKTAAQQRETWLPVNRQPRFPQQETSLHPTGNHVATNKELNQERTKKGGGECNQRVSYPSLTRAPRVPHASTIPPQASPQDPETILAALDPIRQASQYGQAIARTKANLEAAVLIGQYFGPAAVEGFRAFLADSGRKGALNEAGHPLTWFAGQPETYMPRPQQKPRRRTCKACGGKLIAHGTELCIPCQDQAAAEGNHHA